MSLASLFHAIQETGWATGIRESALVYPIIMTTHLTSIAVFGGMILMTDLRLLGVAMRGRPVADVVQGLRFWKRAGLVIMLTCGILLASSKADSYYGNPYFRIKMSLLALVALHALIFRRRVYAKAAEYDRTAQIPRLAKVAAGLSLLLWTSLVCAGRWIAYYEPENESGRRSISPQTPEQMRSTLLFMVRWSNPRRRAVSSELPVRLKTIVTYRPSNSAAVSLPAVASAANSSIGIRRPAPDGR
jgi:hypothetical protein